MCFISIVESADGEAAATVDAPDRGSEVTVSVRQMDSQRGKERSAVIYDLSVPTLALGPELLHAVQRPEGSTADG